MFRYQLSPSFFFSSIVFKTINFEEITEVMTLFKNKNKLLVTLMDIYFHKKLIMITTIIQNIHFF